MELNILFEPKIFFMCQLGFEEILDFIRFHSDKKEELPIFEAIFKTLAEKVKEEKKNDRSPFETHNFKEQEESHYFTYLAGLSYTPPITIQNKANEKDEALNQREDDLKTIFFDENISESKEWIFASELNETVLSHIPPFIKSLHQPINAKETEMPPQLEKDYYLKVKDLFRTKMDHELNFTSTQEMKEAVFKSFLGIPHIFIARKADKNSFHSSPFHFALSLRLEDVKISKKSDEPSIYSFEKGQIQSSDEGSQLDEAKKQPKVLGQKGENMLNDFPVEKRSFILKDSYPTPRDEEKKAHITSEPLTEPLVTNKMLRFFYAEGQRTLKNLGNHSQSIEESPVKPTFNGKWNGFFLEEIENTSKLSLLSTHEVDVSTTETDFELLGQDGEEKLERTKESFLSMQKTRFQYAFEEVSPKNGDRPPLNDTKESKHSTESKVSLNSMIEKLINSSNLEEKRNQISLNLELENGESMKLTLREAGPRILVHVRTQSEFIASLIEGGKYEIVRALEEKNLPTAIYVNYEAKDNSKKERREKIRRRIETHDMELFLEKILEIS
ncbi:MAG: hypothetical protein NZ583_08805 [Desulfobacterota bacterium]|nr:hypothetical protein [Thermodesulfobacteriota bacterium]